MLIVAVLLEEGMLEMFALTLDSVGGGGTAWGLVRTRLFHLVVYPLISP